jgi:hypothetical protein
LFFFISSRSLCSVISLTHSLSLSHVFEKTVKMSRIPKNFRSRQTFRNSSCTTDLRPTPAHRVRSDSTKIETSCDFIKIASLESCRNNSSKTVDRGKYHSRLEPAAGAKAVKIWVAFYAKISKIGPLHKKLAADTVFFCHCIMGKLCKDGMLGSAEIAEERFGCVVHKKGVKM